MNLNTEWRAIVRKAWSVRLMALAFAFTVAETTLPFFSDVVPPRLFAVLSGLSVAGAFVSRLVAQKDLV